MAEVIFHSLKEITEVPMGKGHNGVSLQFLVLFLDEGFEESVCSGGLEQMSKPVC